MYVFVFLDIFGVFFVGWLGFFWLLGFREFSCLGFLVGRFFLDCFFCFNLVSISLHREKAKLDTH